MTVECFVGGFLSPWITLSVQTNRSPQKFCRLAQIYWRNPFHSPNADASPAMPTPFQKMFNHEKPSAADPQPNRSAIFLATD
ncbi:hypothetical protein Pan258_07290 [Symmachiella dynata]|nr:hypothetical protein Pan258_07290 [Symmachiella dynata]